MVICPADYYNTIIDIDQRKTIIAKLKSMARIHQSTSSVDVSPRDCSGYISGALVITTDNIACSRWLRAIIGAIDWINIIGFTLNIREFNGFIFPPTFSVWVPDDNTSFDDFIYSTRELHSGSWRLIRTYPPSRVNAGIRFLFIADNFTPALDGNNEYRFWVGYTTSPCIIRPTLNRRQDNVNDNQQAVQAIEQHEEDLRIVRAAQEAISNAMNQAPHDGDNQQQDMN